MPSLAKGRCRRKATDEVYIFNFGVCNMSVTCEKNDVEYVLLTEDQIKKRVEEMGRKLSELYEDKCPIVAAVLKGGSVFFTDLVRSMDCLMFFDFISVSSYGNDVKSSGQIIMRKDFDNDIAGKDLIIVEDIVDSGLTLSYLKDYLYDRKAKSVITVSLLNKYNCHPKDLNPTMYGFDIEDNFVVGYGLDYAGYYRNLPYIGVLRPEVYS